VEREKWLVMGKLFKVIFGQELMVLPSILVLPSQGTFKRLQWGNLSKVPYEDRTLSFRRWLIAFESALVAVDLI